MTPLINPTKLFCRYTANDAGDALLRTALALRIYRLRTGRYPSDLSALVTAHILKAVPSDPFALSGPLQYGRDSSGNYALYSIGPDGKDDQGKGLRSTPTQGSRGRFVTRESVGDMTVGWYPY